MTLTESRPIGISREQTVLQGNTKRDTTTTNLQRGLLFPYNHSVGIYRCPGDKSTVEGQPGLRRTRTYQLGGLLNFFFNGVSGEGPWYPPEWNKRKVGQLVRPPPTEVFTFIDSHPGIGGGASFVMRIKETSGQDEWATLPGEQHNLGANLAFADGHADRRRWLWSRKNSAGPTPANAADRKDFQFLTDHLPRP